jgi:hypothetical protein
LLHFFLQPLFGGIKGKLVDTFHDSVKQIVDVHGRSLLVFFVLPLLTGETETKTPGAFLNSRRLAPQGGSAGICAE